MIRLILGILLLASPCFASGTGMMVAGGSPPAASGDGPGGTYYLYWDGGHPLGNDRAYIDSGNDTLQASDTAGVSFSDLDSDGKDDAEFDTSGDEIIWPNTSNQAFDPTAAGTICAEMMIVNDGTDDDTYIMSEGSTEYIRVRISSTRVGQWYWRGNGASESVEQGTVAEDTKFTICVSVNPGQGAGVDDNAVSIDGGSTWHTDPDDILAWIGTLSELPFGRPTTGDTVRLYKLWSAPTFKGTPPWEE